jgi:hypothetical protein
MLFNSAHETIVEAKIATAIHIAQSIGDGMSNSTMRGAMSVANVKNSPKMRLMSAAFTSTASRKIYLLFGRGLALV